MTHQELIRQLRSLQGIRHGGDPDPVWKEKTRTLLLATAERTSASAPRLSRAGAATQWLRVFFPYGAARAFKPAVASLASIALALGGWVTTVSASYNALPGDTLYGVKIAAERAQTRLTVDEGARARLRVEFVGRRVDEVAKLSEKPAPAKPEQVTAAVGRIKEEINTVQQQLEILKVSEPAKAAEVASLIDRKAGEFKTTLDKSVGAIPEASKSEVREASVLVTAASVKAVAVLVEAQEQGSVEIAANVIKDKVEDKITTAPAATTEGKEGLVAAKELFAHNDLSGAISKVAEVAKLEQAAVTSTPSLAAPSATNAASITVPLIGQVVPSSTTPLPDRSVSSTTR